jgi:hypothetical protein
MPTRLVETWCSKVGRTLKRSSRKAGESGGVMKVTMNLALRDRAGRDHMTRTDGQQNSWDKMEDYLRSLVAG